jgi:hypothetical protein
VACGLLAALVLIRFAITQTAHEERLARLAGSTNA